MINSTLYILASLALLVYPGTVLATDMISGGVVVVTLFCGLFYMFKNPQVVFPFSGQEKIFFIALSAIFVSAVITTLFNSTDWARADRFLFFILLIPMFILYKQAPIGEKYIWLGLVGGAFIAFIVAVNQVFGSEHSGRATGEVHPILFGDLSLLMGALSLAGLGWFKKINSWLMIVPVMAAIAGVIASALSLSRGGWVSIPFIGLVLLWYLSRFLSGKWVVGIVLMVLIGISGLYLTPQFGVQQRIQTTVGNIDLYLQSKDANDPARSTSIGARFEMWKSAWFIFKEHPVLGAGWGNFKENTQELVNRGKLNPAITRFYHAHNQYLSALAKGGIVALLAIAVLFLIPSYLFIRAIRNYDQPEIRRMAFAGLILIVGYICFGLSEAIFEKSRPVIFFAFYMALFMGRVQRGKMLGS